MKIENLENEIWKDVDEFKDFYQISNLTRIKSLSRMVNSKRWENLFVKERLLKPSLRRGYLTVILSKNGIKKTYLVHRLLALAFIPNPNNYPDVLHRNDIKTDNRLENLYWGNDKINREDAVKNGKVSDWKGENNPNYGRPLSDETKRKISETLKRNGHGIGEKNPNFGKHLSKEIKNKISESQKRRDKSTLYTRPVKQININNDETIKIWPSATEAAKGLGREGSRGVITSVCNKYVRKNGNRTLSALGFKWEYAENSDLEKDKLLEN